MKLYALALFAVIFTAGCIGQLDTGTGGISINVLADPPSIRSDEGTTLFVDIENRDTEQFIKVFVEAFDAGEFVATRALGVPAQQGSLPVPGTYAVEFGQKDFTLTINSPCSSSTQCYDEEYAGCGVCDVALGSSFGTCQAAPRGIKGPGEQCNKHCECGSGSTCQRIVEGVSVCRPATSSCNDGTPLNTCGTGADFCTPYGDMQQSCGGLDAIPTSAYSGPAGPQFGVGDDCSCPFGAVCRGDGTCGVPNSCFTTIYGLKPGEIRTLECKLGIENPQSLIRDITSNIELRTVFRKRLQIDEVLQFLTLDEFRRQETIGSLSRKMQTFSAGDQNLQISISYDKQPPFVEGDIALMQLNIRSIGSGSVLTLNPSDILVGQSSNKIRCSIETPQRSDRGTFAPITCEIQPGQLQQAIENYPFTINVYYDYEIRSSLPVPIQKVG